MSTRSIALSLSSLVLAFIVPDLARSQCLDWKPGFEPGGTSSPVHAQVVFDDGGGPALYVGGSFESAGGVVVGDVAQWNGSSWSPLGIGVGTPGCGVNCAVHALAVFDDGAGPALYAGGAFTTAGGTPASHVAKWNGSSWTPLGSGLDGTVLALVVFDDGTGSALYAGGDFTTAGGAPASRVAKWNGSSWSPVGAGLSHPVYSLVVFDDGGGPRLYGGGGLGFIGGAFLARWTGTTWSSVGAPDDIVRALGVFDDGSGAKLYAGGDFASMGPLAAKFIASWNGASWSALGSGTNASVRSFAVFDDGTGPALHVGGYFTSTGGFAANRTAKWNGSSWSALGSGLNASVRSLAVFDDGSGPVLHVGGEFTSAGGVVASRIAGWDGSNWSALGSGGAVSNAVRALTVFDDGAGPALYAGGEFVTAGGVAALAVARWNGSTWSALDSGLNGYVNTLVAFDDGGGLALHAGGSFTIPGGGSLIAKWNGSSWVPLGAGVGGGFTDMGALAVFDDGTGPALYAGGSFTTAGGAPANNIAKWDGTVWLALGSGTNSVVTSLVVFDAGGGPALYAGGLFSTAGGVPANRVARWDGSSWSALGAGMNDSVHSLGIFDDSFGQKLYAGGQFTSAGGTAANCIASWDGSSWSALGAGMNDYVADLRVFDDGSGPALYAGGFFTTAGGAVADYVARWKGSTWSPVGGGVSGGTTVTRVGAFEVFDDGSGGGPDLYLGGSFAVAGGIPAVNIAAWRGCAGPGTLFCFGDGSGAACPCSNTGEAQHGCQNSAGTGGGLLYASGTTSPDTVVLHASGELPSALSIFLQGNATGTPGFLFGDGLRCATGILKRLYVKSASAGAVSAPGPGDPSITSQSAALGDVIPPGERRYYQTYYRDANMSYCPDPPGSTFNVTNAVKVVW